MKYVIFLWFTLFSLQLQAMLWKSLSDIEKQLIHREIQKYGIEAMRKKIENTPEPNLAEYRSISPRIYPVIVKLEDTFYENNILTDSITAAIFNKVEKIEKKWGYIPSQIMQEYGHEITVIHARNFIGQGTRYYWCEENHVGISSIRIEVNLRDKRSLLEVINNYQ